jgi:hypothetical protein
MNWGQLRTILWLRWRLTRNQWARGGAVNAVLATIVFIVALAIGVGGAVLGFVAGTALLPGKPPLTMLMIWDAIVLAFLFLWMIGVVSEIQRAEAIDIGRMLHLPISLKDVFLLNYAASYVTLSIIVFLPGMLGFSVGLIVGRGWAMIVLVPLVLGLVFMVTAWTYCLRGWLVQLMVNQRRRRAIIAGVTFAFILICQLPNLVANVMNDSDRPRHVATESIPADEPEPPQVRPGPSVGMPAWLSIAHKVIPFLWLGHGARSAAQGNPWPAMGGAVGLFVIGWLGIRRAYRSTLRFYQGQATARPSKRKAKPKKTAATGGNIMERHVPGVPDDAAALALAFFHSLRRAPEIKIMLATQVLLMMFFGAMFFWRRSTPPGEVVKPFIATGVIAVTFLGVSQLMFNLFGGDRGGFRVLVLSPVPRRRILLGKDIAFVPFVGVIGVILLAFVSVMVRIRPADILAASLQLAAAFLLFSVIGNCLSIYVPYRVAPGSLKPTKTSTAITVMMVLSRLLMPLAMVPIFLAPTAALLCARNGWLPAPITNIMISVLLLAVLLLCYRRSLRPLGRALERREKEILRVVTREVE